MAENQKVVKPKITNKNKIADKVKLSKNTDNLSMRFDNFHLSPICLRGKFNNHFKDNEHFSNVIANFLGIILPKISSHEYKEICEGSQEGRILHFHAIDEKHQELLFDILREYNFTKQTIDQMAEGGFFEFSANLGHTYAARIVCHKLGENILEALFFDTNHHIYINSKYTEESLFYESCPLYLNESCTYMPADCFAVSYLDEKKLKESMGYAETYS